jgi:soluble lytic murein transglycosylase
MCGYDALPLVGALSVAVALGCAACGRPDASAASSNPRPATSASAPAASAADRSDAALDEPKGWPALVRDERWDAAWRALNALQPAFQSRPEVRYVRARVALARGDGAAALPLLDGLESMLPLLAADVDRRRAEAELAAGDFEQAGEWFAARSNASAQLEASHAFEKAADVRRARAAADHVVAAEKKTHAQEAEARSARARLAFPPSDSDRADARWLATLGADAPGAADALNLLSKLDPAHPLTARDLVVRAQTLSEAGHTDEALRALELVASAPGLDKVSRRERARARAMVLYHARGRWGEAAKALSESAALGGPDAAEDEFHAARALSRADRDEEAIRGYEAVARRYPTSPWAEQAAFYIPYLRMLHGEWRDCSRGFDAYVHDHPAGEQLRDARSDADLCKLLEGKPKEARGDLERLVEDEPDPLVSARLANMAALAALRDGDRTHAITRWTDVVRSRPLSWPALVASARLVELGAPLPPPIDSTESPSSIDPPPLAIGIPPPADLLHELGLEQDAETALRDRESMVTGNAGVRAPEALCMAYGQLGRAKRRFQLAQGLPSALFATAPTSRTRWAWECAFPSPYLDVVRRAEADEALPRGLLWAVMRQESAFDPEAVSPAHAVGLMQLLPETARAIAEELALARDDARLTSPPYAIRVGARELRKLIDQFHGSVPLALAAYNGGAESVERWASRAPGMQLDTFVERIPFRETRDYVVRVMGNFAHYGYLAEGGAGVPKVSLGL